MQQCINGWLIIIANIYSALTKCQRLGWALCEDDLIHVLLKSLSGRKHQPHEMDEKLRLREEKSSDSDITLVRAEIWAQSGWPSELRWVNDSKKKGSLLLQGVLTPYKDASLPCREARFEFTSISTSPKNHSLFYLVLFYLCQKMPVLYCEWVSESHSVMSDSLWLHGLEPARLLCPWDSPGKNTGVGSCSLLQMIFPTQGSNPGFLHCRQILLPSEPPGKLRSAQKEQAIRWNLELLLFLFFFKNLLRYNA